eukprot:13072027-Ditylum_brightwellii.AAC.1
MQESGILKKPLGGWTKTYKWWRAYYDAWNNCVYMYTQNWYKHRVTWRMRIKNEFHKEGTPIQAPRKLAPVRDVQQAVYGPYLCCTIPVQKLRRKPNRRTSQPPSTFGEFFNTLSKWEHTEELNNGYGYFGFAMPTGSQILWKGQGLAQGNPSQMESLHAESSGDLAVLQFLNSVKAKEDNR